MKKITLFLLLPLQTFAQHIFTDDLDNFWQAVDSIRTYHDTGSQLACLHRLYIDKASPGLQAFMRNKEDIDKKWVALINNEPGFWDTIRRKSAMVTTAVPELEKRITYYQTLYPALKPSGVYFLVGIKQQGGTIRNNLSLIGTEVVLSDTATTPNELVRMSIHEYTHTQQKRPDFQKINVLTSSIREGACDFMAQLVTQRPFTSVYMEYGNKHEAAVWQLFKQEMLTTNNDRWVSTGNNPELLARDLGYFVGYKICSSYYEHATDKAQAIKDIMELDYADAQKVQDFLVASRYAETVK